MTMDTHKATEMVIPDDLRSKIETTVKKYFARYAKELPDNLRTERERYVIACCLKGAAENEEQYRNANVDTDSFVFGVLFSQCISEGTRLVSTPLGDIIAYPKHKTQDCAEDFPGIYVDLVGAGEQTMLACVEYVPTDEVLQTCVYGDCLDDSPTDIRIHENTDAINEEE